jgi:hypothetical protein
LKTKDLVLKIYLISDYRHLNLVRRALENIASSIPMEIEQADYFNIEEEVTPQIIESIRRSDVVIADISNEKPNLYYEVGVAHALNKPVIIVSQTNNFNRFSLLTYRFYQYGINENGIKQLSFFLKEILSNPRTLEELKPRRTKKENIHFKEFNSSNNTLKEILLLQGLAKAIAFEKWLYALLREIPGFDVQHNTTREGTEYDFIIWNSNHDADIERLGNPIPVEVKATARIDNNLVYALVTKARLQGFRSFILITTASANEQTTLFLATLKKEGEVSIILLDRSDLENINTPQDLYKSIIKSYRKFFVS